MLDPSDASGVSAITIEQLKLTETSTRFQIQPPRLAYSSQEKSWVETSKLPRFIKMLGNVLDDPLNEFLHVLFPYMLAQLEVDSSRIQK